MTAVIDLILSVFSLCKLCFNKRELYAWVPLKDLIRGTFAVELWTLRSASVDYKWMVECHAASSLEYKSLPLPPLPV